MSFWTKFFLWVLKIGGFKGGIGVPKPRGSLNSTGAGLLNHQTSKNSPISFWTKILFWCMNFESLKVELGFPGVGDPLILPGRGCLITKHLKLV
jgi:hypothetical protein